MANHPSHDPRRRRGRHRVLTESGALVSPHLFLLKLLLNWGLFVSFAAAIGGAYMRIYIRIRTVHVLPTSSSPSARHCHRLRNVRVQMLLLQRDFYCNVIEDELAYNAIRNTFFSES